MRCLQECSTINSALIRLGTARAALGSSPSVNGVVKSEDSFSVLLCVTACDSGCVGYGIKTHLTGGEQGLKSCRSV